MIVPKQQTTVDFAEIFKYAETKHGVHWNPSNDLFFRTQIIQYRRVTSYYLGECLPDELLNELSEPDYEVTDEIKAKIMSFTTSNEEVCSLIKVDNNHRKLVDIASMILAQFAIENKLDEFLILST